MSSFRQKLLSLVTVAEQRINEKGLHSSHPGKTDGVNSALSLLKLQNLRRYVFWGVTLRFGRYFGKFRSNLPHTFFSSSCSEFQNIKFHIIQLLRVTVPNRLNRHLTCPSSEVVTFKPPLGLTAGDLRPFTTP